MIEINYFVLCDNCGTSIEYKKKSHEQFIIDFLKAGWLLENKGKNHFCCKKCVEVFYNKEKKN